MKSQLAGVLAALMLATTAQAAPSSAPGHDKAPKVCAECGRVTSVGTAEIKGESNAKGLIAGGAVGAILGNQVGSGNGRSLATIAGAVGGAYAGRKAQEHMNTKTVWQVHVKYDNGRTGVYNFEQKPAFVKGDHVRKHGGGIERRAD